MMAQENSEVVVPTKPCDLLVVDSAGFIRNSPLRSLGEEIVTLREVVSEIRDKATRQRLQVLPYELTFKEADPDDIRHVTEFSKKTGDYPSLSATDLRVLALTYALERSSHGGSAEHLRTEPQSPRPNISFYHPGQNKKKEEGGGGSEEAKVDKLPGFYMPEGEEEDEGEESSDEVGRQLSKPSEESVVVGPWSSLGADLGSGDCEEAFSSFRYWRDPLPEVPVLAPAKPDKLGKEAHRDLDRYFATRSYCVGYQPSALDQEVLELLEASPRGGGDLETLPHLARFVRHARSFPKSPSGSDGGSREEEVVRKLIVMGKEENENVIEDFSELHLRKDGPSASAVIEDDVESEDHAEDEEEDGEEENDDEEEDDGEDGWITPSNLTKKKREMSSFGSSEDAPQHVKVACLTTDFAMQNVLRQMGLNVLSPDGQLIRSVRTWVRRCYACFATTSDMTRKFCPKCGNATLKRVSCTVDPDGRMQVHISTRRRLTGRGKKFSLPAPKGGKHAVNPMLCEDQPAPQQRVSRMAGQRTDALAEDYTAGNSPFAMRDVTSRSAMLGVSGPDRVGAGAYWNRSNPNAGTKKTGNRRKKRNA